MLGVSVNALAIVAGSLVGILFKNALSERMSSSVRTALGVITIVVGTKMAFKSENILFIVGCVAAGGVLGASWRCEEKIERLGEWLKRKITGPGESQFAAGFSIASILYCVGAMAVVGSIDSGLRGNHEVLFAKAALDGVISVTFAAIYGIGVAFSALPVFLYQGAIALSAARFSGLAAAGVIDNLSGVGGILVVMIGLSVSGIKKIPVGDYFPAVIVALLLAPLIAAL